jgi:hypothetical protein
MGNNSSHFKAGDRVIFTGMIIGFGLGAHDCDIIDVVVDSYPISTRSYTVRVRGTTVERGAVQEDRLEAWKEPSDIKAGDPGVFFKGRVEGLIPFGIHPCRVVSDLGSGKYLIDLEGMGFIDVSQSQLDWPLRDEAETSANLLYPDDRQEVYKTMCRFREHPKLVHEMLDAELRQQQEQQRSTARAKWFEDRGERLHGRFERRDHADKAAERQTREEEHQARARAPAQKKPSNALERLQNNRSSSNVASKPVRQGSAAARAARAAAARKEAEKERGAEARV